MKTVKSIVTVSVMLVAMGVSASTADAAPQVWGACGIATHEDKVVATYGRARLLCGNNAWGFRHIQQRHEQEWEQLAAIENRN